MIKIFRTVLLFIVCYLPTISNALEQSELEELIVTLAPKVSAFNEVWSVDPHAEFYAGTVRDFAYWILSHFNSQMTKEDEEKIIKALKSMVLIDIRSILGYESDIDVLSSVPEQLNGLPARSFGIRKIDAVGFDRFDRKTEIGRSEIDQGYIAIEKMRLSKNRIFTDRVFGDGIKDILIGRLSIQFSHSEKFWRTYYASRFENHPILLVLRYLRLVAQHFYRTNKHQTANVKHLLALVPDDIQQKVQSIIQSTIGDPKFEKFLETSRGKTWFNQTMIKSFRSYTDPTATMMLYNYFDVLRLFEAYASNVESPHQFLFRKSYDSHLIASNQKKWGLQSSKMLMRADELIPGLTLYHGTRSEAAYRSILFQGVLPSSGGAAGRGLYAVESAHRQVAINVADTPDRVVELKIKPDARIVNITKGAGKALYEKYSGNIDAFAEAFGIDIIIYAYQPHAFVIKNSSVIDGINGYRRKLRLLNDLIEDIRKLDAHSSPIKIVTILRHTLLSPLLPGERERLMTLLFPLLESPFLNSQGFINYFRRSVSPENRIELSFHFLDFDEKHNSSNPKFSLKILECLRDAVEDILKKYLKGRLTTRELDQIFEPWTSRRHIEDENSGQPPPAWLWMMFSDANMKNLFIQAVNKAAATPISRLSVEEDTNEPESFVSAARYFIQDSEDVVTLVKRRGFLNLASAFFSPDLLIQVMDSHSDSEWMSIDLIDQYLESAQYLSAPFISRSIYSKLHRRLTNTYATLSSKFERIRNRYLFYKLIILRSDGDSASLRDKRLILREFFDEINELKNLRNAKRISEYVSFVVQQCRTLPEIKRLGIMKDLIRISRRMDELDLVPSGAWDIWSGLEGISRMPLESEEDFDFAGYWYSKISTPTSFDIFLQFVYDHRESVPARFQKRFTELVDMCLLSAKYSISRVKIVEVIEMKSRLVVDAYFFLPLLKAVSEPGLLGEKQLDEFFESLRGAIYNQLSITPSCRERIKKFSF